MEDLNQDSWPFIFLHHGAVEKWLSLPSPLPVWVIFPCCASMGNVLKTASLSQRAARVIWSGSHFPSLSRLSPAWSTLLSTISSHCSEMKHACLWTSVDQCPQYWQFWKLQTKHPKDISVLIGTMSYRLDVLLFLTMKKRRAIFRKKYCWCPCWTLTLSYSWKTCWGKLNVTRMGGYGCKLCSILCYFGPWPSGNILSISEMKHFLFRSSIMSKMCK